MTGVQTCALPISAGSLTVCTEALKAGASEGLLDELYPLGLPAQYGTDAASPFLQLLMVSALQDSLQAHPNPAALRLLCHPGAAFSWSVLSKGWADRWQAFALRCVELALKEKPAGDVEWDRARAFAAGFFSWLGSLMDTVPVAFRMGKAMDAAAYHAAYSLRSLLGQYAVLALMEHDAARDGMLEE